MFTVSNIKTSVCFLFVQIETNEEMQYDDAFTIQKVDEELVHIFNQMAGMVPFIQKLIADVSHSISPKQIVNILINWYSESNRICFRSVFICFLGVFTPVLLYLYSVLFTSFLLEKGRTHT